MTQIPRVKLTLNKYMTTWEGKVLRYLHDHHPSKKGASNMVMELSLANWLPSTMRNEGASEEECREAALYSVQFLLSQACAIKNEFNLPNVEMQGFVGEKGGGNYIAVASSNNVLLEEPDINNEREWDDDDDDEMLDVPNVDAGFRI